jgi:predicted transcriptional regulator of viral defense system
MSNLKKLPLEQRIYTLAKDAKNSIVAIETIKSWRLASNGAIRVALHNLCKKSWFLPLKRGLYAVQPYLGGGIEDPFYAAQLVYGGYLAFSSALYLHKLGDEMPFTVFTVTKRKSSTRRIGEYEFRAVALGRRAIGAQRLGDYYVSTLPKTLYDCLYMPQYSGGHAKILRAVYNARMDSADWREFMLYVGRFESGAFCQRAGYLLSMLAKTGKKVPAFVLNGLWGMEGRSITRLQPGSGGKYDPRWRVVDNVGERELLGWWF